MKVKNKVLPCDEEAPETLRLDEEAVARYHELSDELIERKYHFYEEMTSVMDGCEGLVDFSEDRRELEKLLDEIQQMKTYKRMLDEYADEMRRMDNWNVEYTTHNDGSIILHYKDSEDDENGYYSVYSYKPTGLPERIDIYEKFIAYIETELP